MLIAGSVVAERFVIEKVLGEGGIARVYRVRHRQLGTVHALKVLTLQREKMSERLLLEGRIQARMRHPNIVAVTDVLAVDGRPALLMEFVDGASMEGWLLSGPEIYLDDGLTLFSQILAGVHAAHLQGVLHRDLKPANVLLAAGPAGVIAKVSDFGIAKVAIDEQKSGLTATGVPMGTPGYMAPEQFTDSAAADARSDIFALGVMLYELVTGRQPFLQGDLLKILNATATGAYIPSDQIVPDLPAHIVDAITRALSPEPEDRFPDCASLARAVFAERGDLLADVLSPSGSPAPLKLGGISATSTLMMPSLTDELEASTGSFSAGTAVPLPSTPPQAPTFGGLPPQATAASAPASASAPLASAPSPVSAPPAVTDGSASDSGSLTIIAIATAVGMGLTLLAGGLWYASRTPDADSSTSTEVADAGVADNTGDNTTSGVGGEARGEPERREDASGGGVAGDADGTSKVGARDETARTEGSVEARGTAADNNSAPVTDARGDVNADIGTGNGAADGAADGADNGADNGTATNTDESTADDGADGTDGAADANDTTNDKSTNDGASEGTDDAAGDAVADVEPPPEAAPSYPSVTGTWRGVANRRPMVLRLNSTGDGMVSGEIVFTGGTSTRSIPLAGRVDESGNLSLQEPGGQGLQLSGSLAGSTLSGAYLRTGQKKSLAWNATRE